MIPKKIEKNGTAIFPSDSLKSLIQNLYSSDQTCFNCKKLNTCPYEAGIYLVGLYNDPFQTLESIISVARGIRETCSQYEFKPRGS